jgi:SpoVK/Ycf46/Vps4 family AAA+-type ATPase
VVFEVIVISSEVINPGDAEGVLARIITKLAIENEYNGYQHESYFEKIYTRNGQVDKCNVFNAIDDANRYALKNLNEEIERLENNLAALEVKKARFSDALKNNKPSVKQEA